MIRIDQIPDEVWHTAMSTYHKTIRKNPGTAWQQAIAAALNSWSKVCSAKSDFIAMADEGPWLILPLPTEASDE